jgi:hypothetical protein
MRRVLTLQAAAVAALTLFSAVAPSAALAQQRQRQQNPEANDPTEGSRSRPVRIAPLRQRANAGPCPYVKILYDAARYVEMADNRPAVANIGYTGEIEGVTAGCSYRGDEPITVQVDALFRLGRGPQAASDQRTYRYWVAVTARNEAVLAKEYFDLPVNFEGARTASVTQQQTIVIPRRDAEVSGSNFEILIGFDVTPEMAAFNRDGSRFRVNAGTAPATPAPAQ